MFEELADYRAFELLRSHSARSDYLLTKQARIIAMTCTHAALIRRKLVELGFKYDNMVMEESAQILEVETFIPMMLQVCGGHCVMVVRRTFFIQKSCFFFLVVFRSPVFRGGGVFV